MLFSEHVTALAKNNISLNKISGQITRLGLRCLMFRKGDVMRCFLSLLPNTLHL